MPLLDNIKPDLSRSSDFVLKPPHCILIACGSPTLLEGSPLALANIERPMAATAART